MKVPKLHAVGRLESTARVTKSNVRANFFSRPREVWFKYKTGPFHLIWSSRHASENHLYFKI